MKRNLKTVEKRTFALKNAIPRFVSFVTRGANLTPLSELRYSDSSQFSEVEINRIEFSKANFDKAAVEAYLQENDYADYTIVEEGYLFVVPGVDTEAFEEVTPIVYNDGVQFFVGKLKQPEPDVQPVNEVTDVEVHDFSQDSPNPDAATSETEKVTVEVVQEGEEVKVEEPSNEEVKSEDTDTSNEEGKEGFTAEEVEEVKVETYSDLKALFTAKFDVLRDEFISAVEATLKVEPEQEVIQEADPETKGLTKEEVLALFKELMANSEKEKEEVVDEKEIVVQNSQVIQTEEFSVEDKRDEKVDKFNQRKKADLFGLRD
jgi:hypothetical protein